MKKRMFIGLLWFYVTWTAWAFVAAFTGLSELWGPVLGAAVAMVIAGDPMRRIWVRGDASRPAVAPTLGVSEPA